MRIALLAADRLRTWIIAAVASGMAAGCSTPNHTVGDAVVGTGLGAFTGAIIGSMTGRGNAGAGALIGAAAGGLGGALVGQAQDAREERDAAVAHAAYADRAAAFERDALSNADVVHMAHNGVSDAVIVSSIRARGGRFDTTPDGIIQLHASGVSDPVIQAMSAARVAPPLPPRRVVVRQSFVEPDVIVVPPAPSVGVVIGGYPHWHHHHHHGHCW